MKEVLEFIERRGQEGRRNPFIQWLQDDSVPTRDRLSLWLQRAGIFVFGFKDLHGMILPYPDSEAVADDIKMAINVHANEDANHWPWYLNDIKALGLDDEMKFTKALELLWGTDTEKQRRGTYRLCQLADRAQDPVLRYCLIMAIETFGHIIFDTLESVAHQFEEETGIRLQYLGHEHAETESGGLQTGETESGGPQADECGVQKRVFALKLSRTQRAAALEIAAETCDALEERWNEFYGWVNGK